MTDDEQSLLARAELLCLAVLQPIAESVDRAGVVPRANLVALAEAGLVGITTPRKFGGSETSAAFRAAFIEMLCSACGSTYFVLTQHLGCCGQIAASGNPILQAFLPEMAAGRHWVGVAFGHLRRPKPMLRAVPVSGGWRLTGTAPWVTGWPILSGVIYGAHLPDGRHIYLYAAVDAGSAGEQVASPPLPLCAMGATETVEVTLNGLFVPESQLVRVSTPADLARADQTNTVANVAPMLGVASGAIRHLSELSKRKQSLEILPFAVARLTAELDDCRATCAGLVAADSSAPGWQDDALKARAWAIDLGVRAAHAALAAGSGASNSLDNPAQRRFREAMFYTVFQQTGDVLTATVERLTGEPNRVPVRAPEAAPER